MPQWFFDMVDNMSGPARMADRELSRLQDELRGTEKALLGLNKASKETQLQKSLGMDITKQQREETKRTLDGLRIQRMRLGLQRDETKAARALAIEAKASLGVLDSFKSAISPFRALHAKTEDLKNSLRHAAESGGLFRSAMSGVGSVLSGMATAAAGTAAAVAGIGAAIVVSTAQAAEYGEAQRRLLMTQFGATEGARQYEILLEYSNRYGTQLHDTMEQFQTFSRAGFDQPTAVAMMQQVGDAAAAMGPEAASGMTLAIGQIMQKVRPSMQDLNQMAERGLPINQVFQEMGTSLRKTAEQVQQMFSAGQISKVDEMNAIIRVLNKNFSQGGLAGTAMANRLNTIGGRIDLIKARWTLFQTRVGETNAFAPVNDFLGKIADMMDGNTEKGKEFQGVLNDMFTGLFGAAGRQDPVKMFKDVAEGIRTAWTVARDLFAVLGDILSVIKPIVKGWKFMNDVAHGRAINSSELNGISMDESMRGVRGDGHSNQQILAARAMGESAILPAAERTPAAMMAARHVTTGDINVTVNGVSGGAMTPEEAGQAAGQAVESHVNRSLSSAAASQGNPT